MSVTIIGFKEYGRKLRDYPKVLRQRIDAEVEDLALDWVERAIASAPADEGFLRNGISAYKQGTSWYVVSRAAYSAYMEWGTRSLVQVPAELSNYAQQFKGKSFGSFADMLIAIRAWVKRKGIDEEFAFIIALKILRVGVRPHPFFFIHKAAIEIQMKEVMKKLAA